MSITKPFKNNREALASLWGFMEQFREGILLFDSRTNTLKYMNRAAEQILGVDGGVDSKLFSQDIFAEDEVEKLRADGFLTKYINHQAVRLSIECQDETDTWLRLTGEGELNRFGEEIGRTSELNRSMRKLLMEYDQNSFVIADGAGVIIFAGQETVENCGYEKDWYLGKSVYKLEEERIFYPSVIKMAIETKQAQVVIQNTRLSKKLLIAIGVPIFDGEGNIERVVSITKDYTDLVHLSSIIGKMEFGMNLTGESEEALEHIITCNEKMLEIKSLIKFVAPTDSTVLILGGTGTGKEVLANAIHSLSHRKNSPFVVVSCGSLSPNIVESELFGYEAGSFTGASREGKMGLLEAADGGTVFLDEIGELPLDQQVKLLHVLQEKSIVRVGGTKQIPLDIRVVAATNRDLKEQIECGQFREDLYYRLNVVSIKIPALCERREDIPLLVKYFTKKFNRKHGKNKVISRNVIKLLSDYEWPGNIRELENSIENLIVTSPSNYIDVEALPEHLMREDEPFGAAVRVKEIAPLAEIIEEAERQLLTLARKQHKTTSEIAKVLKVNQSTVSRKLNGYGIK